MISLVLPFPPRQLSPNARPHFFEKSRVKQVYQQAIYLTALEQLRKGPPETWPRLPLKPRVLAVVEYVSNHTLPDEDNAQASLKALWDALVSAHILQGDTPADLHIERFDVRREDKAEVRVTLRGAE